MPKWFGALTRSMIADWFGILGGIIVLLEIGHRIRKSAKAGIIGRLWRKWILKQLQEAFGRDAITWENLQAEIKISQLLSGDPDTIEGALKYVERMDPHGERSKDINAALTLLICDSVSHEIYLKALRILSVRLDVC